MKHYKIAFACAILLLTGSLAHGQSAAKQDPPFWYDDADDTATIYFLSSDDVPEGGWLAIYGDDFRTGGRVTLNGVEVATESWSNRKIVLGVPAGSSGPVVVDPTGGDASEPRALTVHDGRILHLDASAPNGGNGSASQPYNDPDDADFYANPGDQIWVHGGTYTGPGKEGVFDADRSGRAGETVTWFAMPGETVEIDASTASKSAIRIDASYVNMVGMVGVGSPYNGVYVTGGNGRVVDCELKDGNGTSSGKGQGINIYGEAGKALGNYVHDNYSHGFYIHADDLEIAYNYVANSGCCGSPSSYGYGIQLYVVDPGPVFTRGKVYRNYVTTAKRSGFVVGKYADGIDLYENIVTGNRERCVIVNYGATNTKIRNNVCYENDVSGNGHYEIDLYDGSGAEIHNNAVTGTYGIRKRTGFTGTVTIDANLYDGTTRWAWDSDTYTSLSAWRSGTGSDNAGQAADPSYRDPSSDDFRPAEGSALIDAGDDGRCARPPLGDGCDQGAFESVPAGGGGGGGEAPPYPENLRRTDKRI